MAELTDNFISNDSKEDAKQAFVKAIDTGLAFKLQSDVRETSLEGLIPENFFDEMPLNGRSMAEVQQEFETRFLPYSYNFASPNFMGFPDAGNSIAAITGNIMADFMQQNLINQSFCSPVGTFVEVAVIKWLREI